MTRGNSTQRSPVLPPTSAAARAWLAASERTGGRRIGPGRTGGWNFVVLTLALIGCEPATAAYEPAPATTDDWPASEGEPLDVPHDASEPFDIRLAAMFPALHAQRERLCDLAFVGARHSLRRDEVAAYDPPVSHRVTVRCRASSGEGWADLVFPKESASLAPSVREHARIRVRLRGVAGFSGYPVMEFVAQVSPEIPQPTGRRRTIAMGSHFDAPAEGTVRSCAVASVGAIEPLPDATGESHRALVSCRHVTGSTTVEVRFPREKAMAALRMNPGEVVPLRIVASDGHHVTTVYAGP